MGGIFGGLGYAQQEVATTVSTQSDPTAAVNAAIASTNAKIQQLAPSVGANPLQKLMDMVGDTKFIEIIRLANASSKKPVRTVRGVAISMEPVQAADAKLPAALQPVVLKLRVLAAWMVLARFAPVTLAKATMQWLLNRGIWSAQKYAGMLAKVWARASSVVSSAAQAGYAASISAWHAAQPRTPTGALITSGPLFDAWRKLKPPTPPGITELAGYLPMSGLSGLSGSSLKRAVRAMSGLGEAGEVEGGGDEIPPDAGTAPNPDVASGAAGDAGTTSVNAASQGEAGVQIPPQIWGLITMLLQIGGQVATQTVVSVLVPRSSAPAQPSYTYNPDGTSPNGGPTLPLPGAGLQYDSKGNLVPTSSSDGIPGWLIGLGILAGGYALTRK